jgi:hypothetical protein
VRASRLKMRGVAMAEVGSSPRSRSMPGAEGPACGADEPAPRADGSTPGADGPGL